MKHKSVTENVLLNIIYTLTNMIFPLLTFPYVSRIILVDLLGRVSFFQSISSYAIMLASLGISTYGIREVARCRDDREELSKTTQELLIINCIGTIIVVCVVAIMSIFVDRLRNDTYLFIINILLVLTAPLGVNWLYSGIEQYSFITKRAIAVKLMSLVAIFVFVRKKEDYVIYALIIVISSVVTFIVNFIYSQKFITLKPVNHDCLKHIKPMLVLFASIMAINIYTHLDSAMLGLICDDRQVGLYTIAVYVKTALLTMVNAISAVLLPRVSYFFSNNATESLNRLLRKSVAIISMIALPITFFFVLEAKDCILILGGPEYVDAVACMQVIMPVLFISGFSNITGNQILIPQGKEKYFMKAVISGAFVDLALNILLMPKYGCLGAAIATLIAEIVQMSIQTYFAKHFIVPNVDLKETLIIVLSTCLAIMLMHTIQELFANSSYTFHFIISVMAFFVTYLVALIVFKEEYVLSYARRIFGKKTNI